MPSSLEVNVQGQGFSTVDRAGTAPGRAEGADPRTVLLEEEILSLFH